MTLSFVKVYLDDIIIKSCSAENIRATLKRYWKDLDAVNLRINPKKVQWAKTEIKILGFIIQKNSSKAHPEKIRAIKEMPSPRNKTELQQVLGLSGYYRRFIQDYAGKQRF